MSHLHEPAASSDSADLIFRRAPWLGWTVTTDDDEPLLIPLVWFRDGRPIDWQGGRKIVEDTIWGSGRVLRQDGGAQPLTLTTNAVFRNKATFQRFWRYQERQGTVTMNAAWTMHAPDRTIHKHGVDYA